jgi:hypothetical protein
MPVKARGKREWRRQAEPLALQTGQSRRKEGPGGRVLKQFRLMGVLGKGCPREEPHAVQSRLAILALLCEVLEGRNGGKTWGRL